MNGELPSSLRRTCKVNGKGRSLTRMTSESLKFFKFELDVYDYVPETYASANFHFNPFSGGFSPDRRNIHGFGTILVGYTVFFSRARTQVEPVDGFSIRRDFT